MKFKALVAGTVAAASLLGSAAVAGAAPEPTGWDDVNDLVVGGGSDTTYRIMQEVELLYNQSPGCETINTTGSPDIGKCITPNNGSTVTNGNWDHDYAVGKFPTGSTAGVRELQLNTVDYARSSRGPRSSGETDLNFWAFGKDGLAIITLGTRTPANITLAQLQGIWNCSITDWSSIPGQGSGLIEPVGMNSASGTKATFESFLGFDPNAGACVRRVDPDGAGPVAPFFPFENDVKQIQNSPTTITNLNNVIWWMSYAEFRAWSFKRQDAKAWSVNGIAPSSASISNNSYPFTRFIYHVTKKVDATPDGATENVLGADGGKGGAVREMTEFMCKGSTSHSFNDYTGLTQYQELGNRYTLTGFIRLPLSERTNGICAVFPG